MSQFYDRVPCFDCEKLESDLEKAHKRIEELAQIVGELGMQKHILSQGIKAVTALVADSEGVSGLHLNGDVAHWSDLCTGGQFETWLIDFDEAAKLIQKGL